MLPLVYILQDNLDVYIAGRLSTEADLVINLGMRVGWKGRSRSIEGDREERCGDMGLERAERREVTDLKKRRLSRV